MGLFSRFKEPEGPLPSLIVHISTPEDKVFHPDDTVTGHVSFSTPIPLTPQALEINFWGMSTVWLRTSHSTGTSDNRSTEYRHYRDNAPLFQVCTNVLETLPPPAPGAGDLHEEKGASTLQHDQKDINQGVRYFIPDRTYTFPFQFRVPAGTSSNRSGFYRSDNEAPWTVQPHPLPPTMFWGTMASSTKEYPNHAFVEYGITSRLICPGVGTGKHKQDPIFSTALINFAPLNPYPPNTRFNMMRNPKNFTIATSALAGIDQRAIGFRQSLRDKFSSSTPSLTFELAVDTPDLLTAGGEFRFRASFTALEQSGNVVKIPSLAFRVVKLQLVVFTFARAPRDWKANKMMSGSHGDGTPTSMPNGPYQPDNGQDSEMYETKVLLNALPEVQTLELDVVPLSAAHDAKGRTEGEQGDEQPPAYDLLHTQNQPANHPYDDKKQALPPPPPPPPPFPSSSEKPGPHEHKSKEKEGASSPSSSSSSQHVQQAKSCSAWFAARIPSTTPPSFVSFAITRAYRLQARVALEVAGKKVETDVEGEVNALVVPSA